MTDSRKASLEVDHQFVRDRIYNANRRALSIWNRPHIPKSDQIKGWRRDMHEALSEFDTLQVVDALCGYIAELKGKVGP